MIQIALLLRPHGAEPEIQVLTLSPYYGADSATAHTLVSVALTAAKRPVLADAEGEWWRFRRSRLRGFVVWDTDAVRGPFRGIGDAGGG